MKLVIAAITSAVLLSGCIGTKPPACEGEFAVNAITNHVNQFSGNISTVTLGPVITTSIDRETGNQTCKTTISFRLSDETNSRWIAAQDKLESSIDTTHIVPLSPHVPRYRTIRDHLVNDPTEEEAIMFMLLSQTSFIDMFLDYIDESYNNVNMPENFLFWYVGSAIQRLYDDLGTLDTHYQNAVSPLTFELQYRTSLVKIDGKTVGSINVVPAAQEVERHIQFLKSVNTVVDRILK